MGSVSPIVRGVIGILLGVAARQGARVAWERANRISKRGKSVFSLAVVRLRRSAGMAEPGRRRGTPRRVCRASWKIPHFPSIEAIRIHRRATRPIRGAATA
jgi:hypothetical protein